MQVIYKLDLLFASIYAAVILALGLLLFVLSQQALFIAVSLLAEGLYLFFTFKKPFRRSHAIKQPFPPAWRTLLLDNSPLYRGLDEVGKKRFQEDMQIFLSDFPVAGQRRKQLDTRTRLLVALGAVTLLAGHPDWEPPIRDGVLVYPGQRFSRDFQPGKGIRAGQATVNSPLIITQESLAEGFLYPDDGSNVVYHEFAHYFDFEDGRADGIPLARLEPGTVNAFREAIQTEWQKVSQGRSCLPPYAGVNEAELFAVATEVFFENPAPLLRESPQLYAVLASFYNLDPQKILALK